MSDRPPFVSVVIAVRNGATLVGRAIRSVLRQSFTDWEAWVVDDGSTDGTPAAVRAFSTDPRLRLVSLPANRGVSAARNAALNRAGGEWVAYLDHDDEYAPDYLARVHTHRDAGDVLVFQYDALEERPDHPNLGRTHRHDPAQSRERLFKHNIAVPLGVAHRRALVGYTGGFDVRRARDEDTDLFQRFAAAGAAFAFVPEVSGLYHIRAGSASRTTPPGPPLPPRHAKRRWPGVHAAAVVTPFRPEDGDEGPVVTVTVGVGDRSHALRVPREDARLARNTFLGGMYDDLPLDRLADPPVVVDATAGCGLFAAFVTTAIHARATIHCFEADPARAELLRQNTASLPEVTVYPHSLVDWESLNVSGVDVLKWAADGPLFARLGPRLDRVKVILLDHPVADRARLAGRLPHHTPFGPQRFVRSDLLRPPPTASPGWVGPAAAPAVVSRPDRPRVMFASYHCFDDPASGAALCTRDLFDRLAARGWACGVFTGPNLDTRDRPLGQRWAGRPDAAAHRGFHGRLTFTLHHSTADGYPVSVFAPDPPAAHRPPAPVEVRAFARLLDEAVRRFRPDVVLTYGGDPASAVVPAVARAGGAKVAFWLHNFAYSDRVWFDRCDAVVVPSEFSRDHFRERLGIKAVALPPVLGLGRVLTPRDADARCVTFVNPEPVKGLYPFARLADVLARTRPDIPLLVVEGRGRFERVFAAGVDLSHARSLTHMPNTPDPRAFYRRSRVVVMPSVWRESFGRVAAEAMLNGIPVVASDRGALPEVVGEGGVCLPLPDWLTPDTTHPPSEAEMARWVAAVTRAWDDPAAGSAAATAWAGRWHPDAVTPQWEQFLSELAARRVGGG